MKKYQVTFSHYLALNYFNLTINDRLIQNFDYKIRKNQICQNLGDVGKYKITRS